MMYELIQGRLYDLRFNVRVAVSFMNSGWLCDL